jgi:hypothetical protein
VTKKTFQVVPLRRSVENAEAASLGAQYIHARHENGEPAFGAGKNVLGFLGSQVLGCLGSGSWVLGFRFLGSVLGFGRQTL